MTKISYSPGQIDAEVRSLLRDPRIRSLCQVRAWPYVLAALLDWGVVFGAAAISLHLRNPLVYILSCLIIGGRQHAFFALAHEAAHNRISTSRFRNDLVSDVLFAFPILFDTDAYRQNHHGHHAYLNTEKDPDWMRKAHLPQWRFPTTYGFVLRTYPKFLLWNGPKEWVLVMLQLARILPLRNMPRRESLAYIAKRAAYYGLWALPLTYFSLWGAFAAYWLVPLFFVFPTLQRVRSVAEHFGLSYAHELEQTRNVMAPWYERALFGPHNLHYHLDHHLVATVPFYRLRQLHAILMESPLFRECCHVNTAYLLPRSRTLAEDLFGPPKAAEAPAEKAA